MDKKISIRGVTINKNGEDMFYTSILTNFGILVPIKETKIEDDDMSIVPILDFKYYKNVDDILYEKETEMDEQKLYNEQIKRMRQSIYEMKIELAKRISNNEDIKNEIITINTKTDMSKYNKIKQLIKIFKGIVGEKTDEFIMNYIANDVINDNVENLLLNNLVTSDVFNPKEVIIRENESVLANIDDILKWIRTYKIE